MANIVPGRQYDQMRTPSIMIAYITSFATIPTSVFSQSLAHPISADLDDFHTGYPFVLSLSLQVLE